MKTSVRVSRRISSLNLNRTVHFCSGLHSSLQSGLLGFAFVSGSLTTSAAQAQSSISGDRARQLYETLPTTVTQYEATDYSFVVFTKETDWAKCTALATGKREEPMDGPDKRSTYRCKLQNLNAKKRLDKLSDEASIVR